MNWKLLWDRKLRLKGIRVWISKIQEDHKEVLHRVDHLEDLQEDLRILTISRDCNPSLKMIQEGLACVDHLLDKDLHQATQIIVDHLQDKDHQVLPEVHQCKDHQVLQEVHPVVLVKEVHPAKEVHQDKLLINSPDNQDHQDKKLAGLATKNDSSKICSNLS